MSDNDAECGESAVELTTFSCRECYVYVPIPVASSIGHRAELWNVEKWFRALRLRVVRADDEDDHCWVRLEEQANGELFAECPLPCDGTPLTTAVEPVVDSSRYFVLRVVDRENKKRHTFMGLGFRERGEAGAFAAALDDYRHLLRKKREAAKMRDAFERREAELLSYGSARAAASSPSCCSSGGGGGAFGAFGNAIASYTSSGPASTHSGATSEDEGGLQPGYASLERHSHGSVHSLGTSPPSPRSGYGLRPGQTMNLRLNMARSRSGSSSGGGSFGSGLHARSGSQSAPAPPAPHAAAAPLGALGPVSGSCSTNGSSNAGADQPASSPATPPKLQPPPPPAPLGIPLPPAPSAKLLATAPCLAPAPPPQQQQQQQQAGAASDGGVAEAMGGLKLAVSGQLSEMAAVAAAMNAAAGAQEEGWTDFVG